MNKQEFDILKIDYIYDKLSVDKQQEVEQYLSENPKQIAEIDALRALLNFDTEIPKVSENRMDARFYTFLKTEKENQTSKKSTFLDQLKALFSTNSIQGKLVYGLGILALGLFLGRQFNVSPSSQQTSNESIQYAKAETEEVRSQLVLELIEQPSANKRLKAVNEASKLTDATEQVIKALFVTLNNDDNVNVRLAAIESLMRYSDKPIVRQGLITSITTQDSPLVQVALADVMLSLQEKNSIDPLKELLNQPNVDANVKEKIDETIKEII